jgi:hypothetical protein
LLDGIHLFQEFTKVYGDEEFFEETREYNFYVHNHNSTKGFYMYLESCTNLPIGMKMFGTSDENTTFPIDMGKSEFTGSPVDVYSESITLKGSYFSNTKMKISLAKPPAADHSKLFSIFTSTKGFGI